MRLFVPKMYVKDIFSIDYDKIKKDGYKVIVFDMDNTIGRVDEDVCSFEYEKFLNELNERFIVAVASNSSKERVLKFCQNLNCCVLYSSFKPSLKSFRKIKKTFNVSYHEMVIVGDQLLTDVLAGKRRGLLTVLVDQIDDYELKRTKFNRKIENIIKKIYNIRSGNYYS